MNKSELAAIIKKAGLRWTKTRDVLLDVLLSREDVFRTVEEIHEDMLSAGLSIDISTVYRNLEMMSKLELVHSLSNPDASAGYKVLCHQEHHHHIRCLSCGKVKMISYCPLEELESIASQSNFTLVDHSIELLGICQECQRDMNKNST